MEDRWLTVDEIGDCLGIERTEARGTEKGISEEQVETMTVKRNLKQSGVNNE